MTKKETEKKEKKRLPYAFMAVTIKDEKYLKDEKKIWSIGILEWKKKGYIPYRQADNAFESHDEAFEYAERLNKEHGLTLDQARMIIGSSIHFRTCKFTLKDLEKAGETKGIDLSAPGKLVRKTINIKDIRIPKNRPGIPHEEREGVFVHSYKCRKCGLEFKLYSWKEFKHDATNVYCPECGTKGGMVHKQKTISTNKKFNICDLKHEICGHIGF